MQTHNLKNEGEDTRVEERELDEGGREGRRNRRNYFTQSVCTASREVPRENHPLLLLFFLLLLCFAGCSKDRGCAVGRPVWAREGECASAHRFAMRSGAMPPSSPPLPSTTTFGTDNGANTPRGWTNRGSYWVQLGRLGLGWYHISYRSYNAVRPPLSPRFSLSLSLFRSHSTAFPHPPATLMFLPYLSSPSHSLSFSLALSFLPRVPSPRVTSRFFSRRHLCLCRLFARFLSPFRSYFLTPPCLLLPRCSALPSVLPLLVTSPRCTATWNVSFFSCRASIHRSLFLFIKRDANALRYSCVLMDVNFPENYFAGGGKLEASRFLRRTLVGERRLRRERGRAMRLLRRVHDPHAWDIVMLAVLNFSSREAHVRFSVVEAFHFYYKRIHIKFAHLLGLWSRQIAFWIN